MRRILSAILSMALLISMVPIPSFSIDAREACDHTDVEYVEATEPECFSDGNIEHWYCWDCDGYWLDEELTQSVDWETVLIPAFHEAVYVEAAEASCDENGLLEHWYCDRCESYWLDEELTQYVDLEELIVIAHDLVYVEENLPDCSKEGNWEHWYCTLCNRYWLDAELSEQVEPAEVTRAAEHDLYYSRRERNTCYEDGLLEHWYCERCGTYWLDEELSQTVAPEDVIIPAGHKLVQVAEKKPTFTEVGNVEYWHCETCNSIWLDQNLSQPSTQEAVTLPALIDEGIIATGECGDNLTWTFDSNAGVLIISGTGEMYDFSETESYLEFNTPWQNVADYILSVVIEEDITGIGSYAFADFDALISVTLPSSLVAIREFAFYECDKLESIVLPDSVTTLGEGVFCWSNSLKNVLLPDGLITVSTGTFSGCSALESIEIPDTVISIEGAAFHRCTSLKSIALPDDVLVVGEDAFRDCTDLISVILPDSLVTIGATAFYGCSSLESIVIPNSVRNMGNAVFKACKSLASVVLPEKLEYLPYGMFALTGIIHVQIPDSIVRIEDDVFEKCGHLESVTFLGKAPKIEPESFFETDTTAFYPASFPSWTEEARKDYGGTITWTPYVSNHEHLEVIEEGYAPTCYKEGLTEGIRCSDCGEILVAQEVISALGYHTYSYDQDDCCNICGNYRDLSDTVFPFDEKEWEMLKALNIRREAEGRNPLTGNAVLQQAGHIRAKELCDKFSDIRPSGEFEDTVLDEVGWKGQYTNGICYACLYSTEYLVSELMEDMISYGTIMNPDACHVAIGFNSFRWAQLYSTGGEYSDITVVVPDNLRRETGMAIDDMNLVAILTSPAFGDCYLPVLSSYCSGYDSYSTDAQIVNISVLGLSTTFLLDGYAPDNCGENLKWQYDFVTNTLSITGTGDMYDFGPVTNAQGTSTYNTPWYELIDKIRNVVIDEGVTNIGSYAFAGCSSLKSIILPDSLCSIEKYSLFKCGKLESIVVPAHVSIIGESAFSNCAKLTSVALPDVITIIDNGAFEECESLTDIRFPNSLSAIGNGAFYGCSSLKSIVIPDSVETIGFNCFAGCSSLTSAVLPKNLEYLPYAIFANSGLSQIHVPRSVLCIEDYAFAECDYLESVTFLGKAPDIEADIFWETDTVVFYPADDSAWTASVMQNYGGTITWIPYTNEHEHVEVTLEAVAPSCTESGLTEGKQCSVCKEILVAQEVVPALGHVEVIDPKVEPTCTQNGLTEGKHCSVCGEVLIPQESIPGRHNGVALPAEPATCEEPGLTEGCYCTNCNEILEEQHAIPPLGHVEVVDEGIAASCETSGLTEGKHCSVCGKILIPQEKLDPTGHNFVDGECTVCGITTSKYKCGENLTWVFEPNSGVLTISGMGGMYDYPYEETPWYEYHEKTKTILVEEGVTGIGSYAFYECDSLVDIDLADTIASINSYAFAGCDNLSEIRFGNGISTISDYVFSECKNLHLLVFDSDAPVFEENAFGGLTAFAYYPSDNETWTTDVLQNYGGDISWVGVDSSVDVYPSITLSHSYLALTEGETAQITANIEPKNLDLDIQWTVENADTTVISVDETGLVTANGVGTAYVIATVAHEMAELTARCRIDVTEELVLDGVQLNTTKATTELYSTDYVQLEILLQLPQNYAQAMNLRSGNGIAIREARFVDEDTAAVFDLVAADDRHLLVVPKAEAIASPKSVKGNYESAVTVTVGEREYTTESVKLTVKKTLPKLKASIDSFNSFYSGHSNEIQINGATVTGIRPNGQLPDWLSLEEGFLVLTENAPRKSTNAKVSLLVDTQEWAVPAALTLNVKNAYKAPALKLSASTVTFASDAENSVGVSMALQCRNKKEALSDWKVTGITAPEGYGVSNFDPETGEFTLKAEEGFRPGKITLEVQFADADNTLPLKVTVKSGKVNVKLAKTTVTLNAGISDSVCVPVTVTPGDYRISGYTLELLDSRQEGQLAYSYENGCIIVATTDTTEIGAAYKLRFTAAGKSVNLTVKTNDKAPEVTLKASGQVDLSFPEKAAVVTASFKNYSGKIGSYTWTVAESKGKTLIDANAAEKFQITQNGNTFELRAKEGAELDTRNTYMLTLKLTLANGLELPEKTVKLPVKNTSVKLKLSKNKLTLNKLVSDSASVTVTCTTKGYPFTAPSWEVTDSKGNAASEALKLHYEKGTLTVALGEGAAFGSTYKVLLKANEYASPMTLTVTVPTEAKSKVTVTLKASGTLDVIRDGSTVTVTPSYKNVTDCAQMEEQLLIYSSADKYAESVNHLFSIRRSETGAFLITKAEGAVLDHTRTYKVQLVTVLGDTVTAESKQLTLKVKMGSAKLTAAAEEATLFGKDKHDRLDFSLTSWDETLNEAGLVTVKDAKYKDVFEIYDYGNGRFAIGFKDGKVDTKFLGKTVTLTLNVILDGNESGKINTTVKLKLTVIK